MNGAMNDAMMRRMDGASSSRWPRQQDVLVVGTYICLCTICMFLFIHQCFPMVCVYVFVACICVCVCRGDACQFTLEKLILLLK